jgi:hypothetical protein
MKKRKEEIIGISILLFLAIFLFIRKQINESKLEEKGVIVLGVFKNETFSSDNGWIYYYGYKYQSKAFIGKVSCMKSEQMKLDSLLFFKILPNSPDVYLQLENIHVPKCIRINDVPNDGWKEIPKDTCK